MAIRYRRGAARGSRRGRVRGAASSDNCLYGARAEPVSRPAAPRSGVGALAESLDSGEHAAEDSFVRRCRLRSQRSGRRLGVPGPGREPRFPDGEAVPANCRRRGSSVAEALETRTTPPAAASTRRRDCFGRRRRRAAPTEECAASRSGEAYSLALPRFVPLEAQPRRFAQSY